MTRPAKAGFHLPHCSPVTALSVSLQLYSQSTILLPVFCVWNEGVADYFSPRGLDRFNQTKQRTAQSAAFLRGAFSQSRGRWPACRGELSEQLPLPARESSAIPFPWSRPPPPRYVEKTSEDVPLRFVFNLATNASATPPNAACKAPSVGKLFE